MQVQKLNETESRLFALLFLLFKEKGGVTHRSIQDRMPHYYKNEEQDSNRRKLTRDLDSLKQLGFNVKVSKHGYESDENYTYTLSKESLDNQLKFSKDELKTIASLLVKEENQNSEATVSLAQKLFSHDLSLFPQRAIKSRKIVSTVTEEETIVSILQAIKDKSPLMIQYGELSKEERVIEPYTIIRRNSEDFYLLAFDRKRKSLRKFIVPRIQIKRQLREEFESRIPLSSLPLQLHPLSLDMHESISVTLELNAEFIPQFQLLIADHPYSQENSVFKFETTNQEFLFPFFTRHKQALQNCEPDLFLKTLHHYQEFWKSLYSIETTEITIS